MGAGRPLRLRGREVEVQLHHMRGDFVLERGQRRLYKLQVSGCKLHVVLEHIDGANRPVQPGTLCMPPGGMIAAAHASLACLSVQYCRDQKTKWVVPYWKDKAVVEQMRLIRVQIQAEI